MSRVAARPQRSVPRGRAPRAPNLPSLNPAAQRVLGELELWCRRFVRGELVPSGDGAPPLAAGERFAVRLPAVRAAGLGRAPASGVLHATDHRVILTAQRPGRPREWALEDLCAVEALGNWGGVALVHTGGDTELLVSAAAKPPSWEDAPGWLKVEAVSAAAAGCLDAWMAQLPQRLGLPGAP